MIGGLRQTSYPYLKLRQQFGKHPHFQNVAVKVLADIRPNEEHAANHILRNPTRTGVQAVPSRSEHDVNTVATVFTSRGMQHTEGGWPKEVDPTEAEHVIRYRRKIEKDEDYIRTVVALGARLEPVIKANNAIDVYEEYFPDKPPEPGSDAPGLATATVLRDAASAGRAAQYLCWHPDQSRRLAVAHATMVFQAQLQEQALASYVWDLNDPGAPESTLLPSSQITALNFNLKDYNVLGAGMYNGQFGVFDLRKGAAMTGVSPIEHSHRDPIYDFSWMQSKTGTEAMTVSTDGQVLWWDTRRLGQPLEELTLREKAPAAGGEGGPVLGVVALDSSFAAGPTKFMVGTENGAVLSCNRKAKNPADRVGLAYTGHCGPVYGLTRNPFYPKFFLSAGDWSVRVWNEDLRTPVITSRYMPAHLTGCRWSPSRPSVFFVTRRDGMLDVWDYMDQQNDPVLSHQVSKTALTAVRLQDSGRTMAVGAGDGSTTVLRLSAGLADMQPNEKPAFLAMLELESGRERNLEKLAKEAKRAKRAADEAASRVASAPPPLTARSANAAADAEARDLEEEFFAAVKAAKLETGL